MGSHKHWARELIRAFPTKNDAIGVDFRHFELLEAAACISSALSLMSGSFNHLHSREGTLKVSVQLGEGFPAFVLLDRAQVVIRLRPVFTIHCQLPPRVMQSEDSRDLYGTSKHSVGRHPVRPIGIQRH